MKRFNALPEKQREIVFYAESRSDWVHFERILEHLLEVAVHPIPYLTSDPNDPVLSATYTNLTPIFIGDGSVRTILFRTMRAPVVVITLPDLQSMFLKRSPHVGHYVYVFHSLVSTHRVYLKGAFDHYDTVLCSGPHHVAEIQAAEAHYGLTPKRLVQHGYGRLDSLIEEAAGAPALAAPSGSYRVLLAPSWGESGILETMGADLVRVLLDAGCRVTVRPHPMSRRTAPACIDQLAAEFSSHAHFELEEDVTTTGSLFGCHIMISDWSGVALEFAYALGRPVIFIDTPAKCRNADYTAISLDPLEATVRDEIGVVISPDRLTEVPSLIERLCRDKEGLSGRILGSRQSHVFNVGSSGRVGAEAVLDLLR
jgi:YidC/Oxa1 family membrane protein insertase